MGGPHRPGGPKDPLAKTQRKYAHEQIVGTLQKHHGGMDERLNRHHVATLVEAQQIIERWTHELRHRAAAPGPGHRTPAKYAACFIPEERTRTTLIRRP